MLRFVADHAPITVGEAAQQFGLPHGLARTTILTMMERLRKKGHLSRRKSGGVFVYRSALDGPRVMSRAVAQFIERSLRGSVSPFAAYLTERGEVSPAELRELKSAIRALKPDRREESR